MGGFFGAISKRDCVLDIFFGVDYHSHLGTRRGGMAIYDMATGFQRQIHQTDRSRSWHAISDSLHALGLQIAVVNQFADRNAQELHRREGQDRQRLFGSSRLLVFDPRIHIPLHFQISSFGLLVCLQVCSRRKPFCAFLLLSLSYHY